MSYNINIGKNRICSIIYIGYVIYWVALEGMLKKVLNREIKALRVWINTNSFIRRE